MHSRILTAIFLLVFSPYLKAQIQCDIPDQRYQALFAQQWIGTLSNPMWSWDIDFERISDTEIVKHHRMRMAGRNMNTREPVTLCEFNGRSYFKRLEPNQLKEYVPFELTNESLRFQRMGYDEDQVLSGADQGQPDTLYMNFRPANQN